MIKIKILLLLNFIAFNLIGQGVDYNAKVLLQDDTPIIGATVEILGTSIANCHGCEWRILIF